MIVLDTNVVSELMKPNPAATVFAWTSRQPRSSIFTTTITQGEILYGIAILPAGRRRDFLAAEASDMFGVDFFERLLDFNHDAALAYASIAAARRLNGRPISQSDAQIAGIVHSRGAGLAT